MKTIILFLFPVLVAAQDMAGLFNSNWNPDQERTIYGNRIIRIEGSGPATNIGYRSIAQVEDKINEEAEEQMWTDEKRDRLISSFRMISPGGNLSLYIERESIEPANTKYFTVIVKDTLENEICREELKSSVAKLPGSDGLWTNNTIARITKPVPSVFYVYVIDALGYESKRHKFKIYVSQ